MATLTLQQLQRALALAEQIQRLEEEFQALVSGNSHVNSHASRPASAGRATRGRGGRRSFSEETRAKMAAAQRARWAARNGGSAKAGGSSAAGGKRKKRELTPEGRARIAAALKARWEKARKTGGPAPNARKKK
jgi:hypothetical protein